jgi:hypothetical protein
MANRATRVASTVVVLVAAFACTTTPTGPTKYSVYTPVTSSGATSVTGKVLVYSPDGVQPAAGANVFGWIDMTNGSGRTTGAIVTGSDGSYSIDVPAGATRLRLTAMSASMFQPCAATVSPIGNGVSRDVSVVSDPDRLGGNLPDALLANAPLLSGVVFETTDQGRQPLANVDILLDASYGDGLVVASTRTDGDGRFVLCGVPYGPGLYLSAAKNGYEVFGKGSLDGVSSLEIELRAK